MKRSLVVSGGLGILTVYLILTFGARSDRPGGAAPHLSESETPTPQLLEQPLTLPSDREFVLDPLARSKVTQSLREVLVVEAETGAPVAGAEVLRWTGGERANALAPKLREDLFLHAKAQRWASVLALVGDAERTDRFGRVSLDIGQPVPTDPSATLSGLGACPVLFAHTATHFGGLREVPAEGPIRLELHERGARSVLVLDPEDQPVTDMTVCCDFVIGSPIPHVQDHERLQDVTDSRGRVQFEGLRARQDRLSKAGEKSQRQEARLEVSAQIAGDSSVRRFVSLDSDAREDWVLRVPATGRLDIRILGSASRNSVVQLEAMNPGEASRPESGLQPTKEAELISRPLDPDQRARVVAGVATFSHVALGLHWRATVWHFGKSVESEIFAGPEAAGEHVAHDVDVSHLRGLKCQLVNQEGEAIANTMILFRFFAHDNSNSSENTIAQSDAEGSAQTCVSEGVAQSLSRMQVSTHTGWPDPNAGAALNLDELPGGGESPRDLGRLVLQGAPLLARGRLRNASGSPETITSAFALMAEPGAAPTVYVRSTGAESFEIRGEDTNSGFVLELRSATGSFSKRISSGTEFIDAVVQSDPGSITAHVLHDSSLDLHAIARLIAEDRDQDYRAMPTRSSTGTSYQWLSVPSGPYRFVLQLPGDSEPSEVVNGIQIEPGANSDPRVEGIVLDTTSTLEIVVRKTGRRSGLDTGHAALLFLRESGADVWVAQSIAEGRGRYSIPVGPKPIDIRWCALGYLPVERRSVRGVATLQLEPAPTVPVELDASATGEYYARLAPRQTSSEEFQFAGAPIPNIDFNGWSEWIPLEAGRSVELTARFHGHALIELASPETRLERLLSGAHYLPVPDWQPVPCFVDAAGEPSSPVLIDP